MQIFDKIIYCDSSFTTSVNDKEFETIQDGIDNAGDNNLIKLCNNFDNISELTLPASGTINIDGQNKYGISINDPLFINVGKNQNIKFYNLKYIIGNKISLGGDDSSININNCEEIIGYFNFTSGLNNTIDINNSNLYGLKDYNLMEIDNSNLTINLFDSFIGCQTGQSALHFKQESDKMVKIKNCTILCSNDNPIIKTGSFIVGIHAYNCISNKRLCNGDITNYIMNNNNRYDSEIIF